MSVFSQNCKPASVIINSEGPPGSESEGFSTDNDVESENLFRKRSAAEPSEVVTVLYDYDAQSDDELTLRCGSLLDVICKDSDISGGVGWWVGRIGDRIGVFPNNFVKSLCQSAGTVGAVVAGINRLTDDPPAIAFSQLKFEEVIGIGGFGKVYKGIWSNVVVAVKAAKIDPDQDVQQILRSVQQEAKLFHLLDHQNIVRLYGVCLELPNLCLVLEHCAGGSLNRILAKRAIPPEVLLDWAAQIARAMKYLHEDSPVCLVHRDLKSSNVMIKQAITGDCLDDVVVKITDFGLAREAYRTTRMSAAANLNRLGVDALTIAYGVAMNNLTLPIPSACPQSFAGMMQDCWKPDPQDRPSFSEILVRLDILKRNKSLWLPDDDSQFHTLQASWREEIQDLFNEVKLKECDLQTREEQLGLIAREQQEQAKVLQRLEEDLRQREFNLVQRELVMLMQHRSVPEPHRRRGKLHVKQLRKLLKATSSACALPMGAAGNPIGSPQNFRHPLSVKHEHSGSVHILSEDSVSPCEQSTPSKLKSRYIAQDASTSLEETEAPNVTAAGSSRPLRMGPWSCSTPNLNKIAPVRSPPVTSANLDTGLANPIYGSKVFIRCDTDNLANEAEAYGDRQTATRKSLSRPGAKHARALDSVLATITAMVAAPAVGLDLRTFSASPFRTPRSYSKATSRAALTSEFSARKQKHPHPAGCDVLSGVRGVCKPVSPQCTRVPEKKSYAATVSPSTQHARVDSRLPQPSRQYVSYVKQPSAHGPALVATPPTAVRRSVEHSRAHSCDEWQHASTPSSRSHERDAIVGQRPDDRIDAAIPSSANSYERRPHTSASVPGAFMMGVMNPSYLNTAMILSVGRDTESPVSPECDSSVVTAGRSAFYAAHGESTAHSSMRPERPLTLNINARRCCTSEKSKEQQRGGGSSSIQTPGESGISTGGSSLLSRFSPPCLSASNSLYASSQDSRSLTSKEYLQ